MKAPEEQQMLHPVPTLHVTREISFFSGAGEVISRNRIGLRINGASVGSHMTDTGTHCGNSRSRAHPFLQLWHAHSRTPMHTNTYKTWQKYKCLPYVARYRFTPRGVDLYLALLPNAQISRLVRSIICVLAPVMGLTKFC